NQPILKEKESHITKSYLFQKIHIITSELSQIEQKTHNPIAHIINISSIQKQTILQELIQIGKSSLSPTISIMMLLQQTNMNDYSFSTTATEKISKKNYEKDDSRMETNSVGTVDGEYIEIKPSYNQVVTSRAINNCKPNPATEKLRLDQEKKMNK
ncbi:45738_t:CDS:2, partial [Gigaspora margarita]